jgi:hypothetical protein
MTSLVERYDWHGKGGGRELDYHCVAMHHLPRPHCATLNTVGFSTPLKPSARETRMVHCCAMALYQIAFFTKPQERPKSQPQNQIRPTARSALLLSTTVSIALNGDSCRKPNPAFAQAISHCKQRAYMNQRPLHHFFSAFLYSQSREGPNVLITIDLTDDD